MYYNIIMIIIRITSKITYNLEIENKQLLLFNL